MSSADVVRVMLSRVQTLARPQQRSGPEQASDAGGAPVEVAGEPVSTPSLPKPPPAPVRGQRAQQACLCVFCDHAQAWKTSGCVALFLSHTHAHTDASRLGCACFWLRRGSCGC
eukprot:3194282-Rhodomonas_salina.2